MRYLTDLDVIRYTVTTENIVQGKPWYKLGKLMMTVCGLLKLVVCCLQHAIQLMPTILASPG